MLIISSRTSSCVLVLMQVLGALFECQGCVPPHILVAQAALPSLVAHTQSVHARGSFVHVPMKPPVQNAAACLGNRVL